MFTRDRSQIDPAQDQTRSVHTGTFNMVVALKIFDVIEKHRVRNTT